MHLLIRGRNKARLDIVSHRGYTTNVRDGLLSRIDAQSLDCFWDIDHPCSFCGKVFMFDETPRSFCCNDGKYCYGNNDSPIAALEYWPPVLSQLYLSRSLALTAHAVEVNNRLALSVVSVRVSKSTSVNK